MWDVIGMSEIKISNESMKELKKRELLCHSAAIKGQWGVGFLVKETFKEKSYGIQNHIRVNCYLK